VTRHDETLAVSAWAFGLALLVIVIRLLGG